MAVAALVSTQNNTWRKVEIEGRVVLHDGYGKIFDAAREQIANVQEIRKIFNSDQIIFWEWPVLHDKGLATISSEIYRRLCAFECGEQVSDWKKCNSNICLAVHNIQEVLEQIKKASEDRRDFSEEQIEEEKNNSLYQDQSSQKIIDKIQKLQEKLKEFFPRIQHQTETYIDETEALIEKTEKALQETETYIEEIEKSLQEIDTHIEEASQEKRNHIVKAKEVSQETKIHIVKAKKSLQETETCIEEIEKVLSVKGKIIDILFAILFFILSLFSSKFRPPSFAEEQQKLQNTLQKKIDFLETCIDQLKKYSLFVEEFQKFHAAILANWTVQLDQIAKKDHDTYLSTLHNFFVELEKITEQQIFLQEQI